MRRCARAGGCRAGLAALAAAVILAGSSGALAALTATSRARAAPVVSALPCDGSVGSSIFVYGSSTRTLSETTIPVCAAGGVTVSFHSTAPGCSAGGPCGYAGLESWRPTGGGLLSLATVRSNGRDATEAILSLGFGAPVLETVTRTGPGGRRSTCQDRSGQFAGFLSPWVRAGRLTIALGNSS